jgi:hypothetical protein
MDTWLIIVTLVAFVVVFALVLRWATRGRERRLESRRPKASKHCEPADPAARQAEEHVAVARDELARSAGVASFGLNLPWRRARNDPSEYRRR